MVILLQFSLLAEMLAEERHEIQVRKKAQEKVNVQSLSCMEVKTKPSCRSIDGD